MISNNAYPLIHRSWLYLMLAVALLFAGFSQRANARDGLRIYISADMEGVAGVVSDIQRMSDGSDYQAFRGFFTDEVNAAIEGAFAAGATEIVVSDSHGTQQNLLVDRLIDKNVLLIRGNSRPLMMMQGIEDGDFSAVILVGYHASDFSTTGVLTHGFTGGLNVRLNGKEMSEAILNAAIAGWFDVPVIFVSGDESTVRETKNAIGEVESAVVKWSYGMTSAKTLLPRQARNLIREKVTRAVKRLDEFQPYRLSPPYVLEFDLPSRKAVDVFTLLPSINRSGPKTVRYESDDLLEVTNVLLFSMAYRFDAQ
jgi:D-amino peptidase